MYLFRDAHAARDATRQADVRDEEGARIISGRRGMTRQPVSEPVLRREVARNVASVLNTVHLAAAEDLTAFRRVRTSILNYGIPDLSGTTIDENTVDQIAATIREALIVYEPRIIPRTIVAERDESVSVEELRVRFTVQAQLRFEPLDIPVEFIAEVDNESGKFRIERL